MDEWEEWWGVWVDYFVQAQDMAAAMRYKWQRAAEMQGRAM